MIIKGIMGTAGPSTIIIQYLKSLGIKIRLLKKSLSLEGQKKSSGERLFGVPLPLLPLCKTEGGVPQLLVNICQFLGDHLGTEGLFRKSGSVIRIKALKAQLEYGECPLDSAHPGDVACLLKQFFRELPLPLIPPELQDPLCQIQETLNEKHRVLATTLVTCLLPAIHANTLCYLCTFLQSVAARSEENRMDSGNLAVVLAPNLFSSGVLGEKLTIGTERQLQLQASAMQTLIEHAEHIGQTPAFILEMISFPANPLAEDVATLTSGGSRRRRRRSMGGLVNEALNKLKSGLASSSATPERAAATDERDHPVRCKVKRKATEDSVPTEQGTAKKRKSVGAGEDEISGTEHGTAAASPLRETGIEGDMFLEVPPAPGPCLELTAVPPDPLTAESTAQAPRARSKKKDGKRGQRSQSGLILVSPAHLERRDKVRNSLRLFHRPRTAKNQTPEGKNAEESSWNYVKRMVTEALEGPIFNGKDLRATSSSLKANLHVDISSSRSSLQTTAVWKSIETEASSGKKSRALRRSLSMPENMADCTKPKEDGNPFQSMDSSTSAENLTQDGGVIKQPEEIPHTPLGFTGFYLSSPPKVPSLHNSISVCALPLSSPCLSKATGQLAQYRSVRKLMLSMPWAPQMADLEDSEQKDWGKLATNSIRRQGARRFGRSLSHESGIGLAEGIEEQNCPEFPPAQKILKGRSVFVSHKNITLCAAGQRSFDILESDDPSLEEVPVDTGDHPTETIFSHSKDPTCFETLSEENKPYCGIFSAHPFYGAHLELIEDCIDL